MAETLSIAGLVVARSSRRRLSGVSVEAWPEGSRTPIARTTTGEAGAFRIQLGDETSGTLLADPNRVVTLVLSQRGTRLTVDGDAAQWTPATADRLVIVEVDDDAVSSEVAVWLEVDSREALDRHQDAILARIAETHNGGWLFTIHPFLLLADVGVHVTEKVRDEIVAQNPHLSALSATAYQAIRGGPSQSRIRVRLNGLFEKATTS